MRSGLRNSLPDRLIQKCRLQACGFACKHEHVEEKGKFPVGSQIRLSPFLWLLLVYLFRGETSPLWKNMWLTSSPPHFQDETLTAPTLQLGAGLQCWVERQAYICSWKAPTPSALQSAALAVGRTHTTILSPGLCLSSSTNISSGNRIGMTACSQGSRRKKP